jgi:hypothetical protein
MAKTLKLMYLKGSIYKMLGLDTLEVPIDTGCLRDFQNKQDTIRTKSKKLLIAS